ncbi:hypothetical protein POM88_007549 [Heracleum sosnowskyi]|uniref:Replication protein A 70 kDa DNA-binding subunit B/D first OB fold domain-containing protein n=1 Tax=Heracleum sosnowskyi TaxID=360622 RepID=A0AAD8J5P8_9APIA|nr:hypothetical protein POM88_007549 [Heracleum sosnowskyi]
MKFKIADERFKVNVTFFNEFGESFEKALKDICEETIVVIIASAKPNKYDGETVLTNFPATKFYLNPKNYSVNNFLISMTLMDCEEDRDMKIYTIEDIKNLSNEYIEKDVLCHVTVKKVEEECNWYANFCTSCGAEITKVDGRFFCHNKECMRVIPYPEKRFRLCTVFFDKTGIVPIIFPDDEIQRLTGKDAFEIINDDTHESKSEEVPKSEGPPTGKSSTRSRRTKTKDVLKCDLDDQSPLAKLKKSCDEAHPNRITSKNNKNLENMSTSAKITTTKYDSFKDLRTGKYDWRVPARILNLWRGHTKTGEPFKSFNLLLLDNKRSRIYAFVQGEIAAAVEPCLEVGTIYLFKNFTVREYKKEDRFRCIHKTIQIVFSRDTKIQELDETQVLIDKAAFDFYDIGDLKQLSQQTTYLTDVIGVVEEIELYLNDVRNRLGYMQTQMKFHLTDGRQSVKVTLWDELAELLDVTLKEDLENPLIIIIGCGRVTEWQNKVEISNVAATTFYINCAAFNQIKFLQKRLRQLSFRIWFIFIC